MFKKLKKRLEVDEGQPPILVSKPGTAVRSSVNSTSLVSSESPQDAVVSVNNSEREKDEKLNASISLDDYNIVSSQEMRELARAESSMYTTSHTDQKVKHIHASIACMLALHIRVACYTTCAHALSNVAYTCSHIHVQLVLTML